MDSYNTTIFLEKLFNLGREDKLQLDSFSRCTKSNAGTGLNTDTGTENNSDKKICVNDPCDTFLLSVRVIRHQPESGRTPESGKTVETGKETGDKTRVSETVAKATEKTTATTADTTPKTYAEKTAETTANATAENPQTPAKHTAEPTPARNTAQPAERNTIRTNSPILIL